MLSLNSSHTEDNKIILQLVVPISVKKTYFVTEKPLQLRLCSLPQFHSRTSNTFDIWFQKAEVKTWENAHLRWHRPLAYPPILKGLHRF